MSEVVSEYYSNIFTLHATKSGESNRKICTLGWIYKRRLEVFAVDPDFRVLGLSIQLKVNYFVFIEINRI